MSSGGLTTATYAALSGLTANEQKTRNLAGDIAAADVHGYKGYETYMTSVVTSANSGTGGVNVGSRLTADIQGSSINTGVTTDLSINGQGFFVVTDNAHKSTESESYDIYFTRAGSFRFNRYGYLENEAGYQLMAWSLDADGNLPSISSIVDSLVPVNFAQTIYEPTPTSTITASVNLDSMQEVAGKSSITFDPYNTNTPDLSNAFLDKYDIIKPGGINNLQSGDGLKVRVSDTDHNFIYGGFLQTASVVGSTVGDLSSSGSFALNIVANGVHYNISTDSTITNSSSNLAVLQNIASQMNDIVDGSGNRLLKANIAKSTTSGEYYLMIGAGDSRDSISVTQPNNLTFIGSTSLAYNAHRFASLNDLTQLLNGITGVTANVIEGEWTDSASAELTRGAKISLFSTYGMYLDNYQAEGVSNFLATFSLNQSNSNKAGYISTEYDPYDDNNNMSGGAFNSHFNKGFSIYDAKGQAHEMMISFLRVDTQKWAVEFRVLDPGTVEIPGRTDGLLQAGYVYFDGEGHLLKFAPAVQSAYSGNITDPSAPITGAALGDSITVTSGTQSFTFNYDPMKGSDTAALIKGANNFVAIGGTGITGSNGDIIDVTVGSGADQITWNFARSGATDDAIIDSLVEQINNTFGSGALIAKKVVNGVSQIGIEIRARDITQAISVSNNVGNSNNNFFSTLFGAGSTSNVAADSARFSSVYELSERINSVASNSMNAAVLKTGQTSGYKLRIRPTDISAANNLVFSAAGANNLVTLLGLEGTDTANNLPELNQNVVINWANFVGSDPNTISINWGSFGNANGLENYARSSASLDITQNGVQSGDLERISIDKEGNILAQFSNSKSKPFYRISVANFVSPNNLLPMTGDVFANDAAAGTLNLVTAGSNGAGKIENNRLEGSNVDIASKLAELIEAQKQYQANAQVLSIVNSEIEYLLNKAFN